MTETPLATVTEPRRGLLRRLYDWVLHWADTRYGTPALGALSFAESSVFPVPPDPLLIALCVARPRRALYYAFICSLASVLGGLAGYGLGLLVWHRVQSFFFTWVFTPELFAKVQHAYEAWDFWVVFAAGFTPIPYKVFTIAAGVFEISLPAFLLASVVGRSARFFLVAGLIARFGEPVKERIEKNFDLWAYGFLALLVLGIVSVKLVL